MRWMNIILAVSVLTMPVLAGSGDQSKFAYDQTRYQITQSLSQTQEEPASEPKVGVEPAAKLVPGKALLLSAIVPGTGQIYAKSPLWAAAFFAIEIGAWAGVAMYHTEGMSKEDEYLAYADEWWTYYDETGDQTESYLAYEYWAASSFGNDGALGTGDEYSSLNGIDDWQQLPWGPESGNEDDKLDFLPQEGFTHELDITDKDQQYYEMIGKYNQFWAGWPKDYDSGTISNPAHWTEGWSIKNSKRENYLNMRKDSNDALDMSKNFTIVVLANHLASALHAGFTVSRHNKKLQKEMPIEGAFRFEPKRINNEFVNMATLRITF